MAISGAGQAVATEANVCENTLNSENINSFDVFMIVSAWVSQFGSTESGVGFQLNPFGHESKNMLIFLLLFIQLHA